RYTASRLLDRRKLRVLRPNTAEGDRDDVVRRGFRGDRSVGAVPVDEGVDHSEEEPSDGAGVHVGADRPVGLGFVDEFGDGTVEGPAPLQGGTLKLGVAAQPQ